MNINKMKSLVLSSNFFVDSEMYKETVESDELVRQTKEPFKYGGIDINVNLWINKDKTLHFELDLSALDENLEDEEYGEQVEDFILDRKINPSLKDFIKLNSNIDFSEIFFFEPEAVVPDEGVVEIVIALE